MTDDTRLENMSVSMIANNSLTKTSSEKFNQFKNELIYRVMEVAETLEYNKFSGL